MFSVRETLDVECQARQQAEKAAAVLVAKLDATTAKAIEKTMPIRLIPKDATGGIWIRRWTLRVVVAPSFWALTG